MVRCGGKKWGSEEELAAVVVEWLSDLRWTVYQEVQIRMYGPIADIVAVNETKLSWIIETKRSFGFKVLRQAKEWAGQAHYVSVAVPMRHNGLSRLETDTLRWLGIGCLEVNGTQIRDEVVPPRLWRRNVFQTNIQEFLTDRHRTFARAGNAQGRRLTPFAQTCEDIAFEARCNPGLTLKELLSRINTHYCSTATAKSCIAKWGTEGKIRGARFEKEGKVWRIYPEEKEPNAKAQV